MLRYKDMARKFLNLAYRAASHPKCTLLVNNTLDMLSKQVEEEMNGVTSPMDPIIAPTNVTLLNDLLSTASLKKKEVETKTSKRKRTWLDKKCKCTKKEVTKKKTIQRCVTRKKVRRFVTRKKKNVQRYLTTQNISDSLSVFATKSFNCI